MLFIIGSIFVTPVLIDYFKTGLVPKIPSFIAAIFFYISAIQSFFGGLMLDTMRKKEKQDFEIKYTEFTDKFNQMRAK